MELRTTDMHHLAAGLVPCRAFAGASYMAATRCAPSRCSRCSCCSRCMDRRDDNGVEQVAATAPPRAVEGGRCVRTSRGSGKWVRNPPPVSLSSCCRSPTKDDELLPSCIHPSLRLGVAPAYVEVETYDVRGSGSGVVVGITAAAAFDLLERVQLTGFEGDVKDSTGDGSVPNGGGW